MTSGIATYLQTITQCILINLYQRFSKKNSFCLLHRSYTSCESGWSHRIEKTRITEDGICQTEVKMRTRRRTCRWTVKTTKLLNWQLCQDRNSLVRAHMGPVRYFTFSGERACIWAVGSGARLA